jgi:hypothetical protein
VSVGVGGVVIGGGRGVGSDVVGIVLGMITEKMLVVRGEGEATAFVEGDDEDTGFGRARRR